MNGGRGGGRNGLRTGGRYGGRTLAPNAKSALTAAGSSEPLVGDTDKVATELAPAAAVETVVVTGAVGAITAEKTAAEAQYGVEDIVDEVDPPR